MDAHIFVAVKRDVQVEVADVKTGKSCITTRDDAVENEFGKFKWSCGHADVVRTANSIPADSNARAIGVILVGIEFTHYFPVGNFHEPIGGDLLIFDDEEGVGSLYRISCTGGSGANSLTQAD